MTSVQGFGGGGHAALVPHPDASLEHQRWLSGASVPQYPQGATGRLQDPPPRAVGLCEPALKALITPGSLSGGREWECASSN